MHDKALLIMSKIAHLAQVLEIENIQTLPGCWEHQIDDHWWIAVNGRSRPIKCSNPVRGSPLNGTKDIIVQPFECYVKYNGLFVGTLNCFESTIIAGRLANENTFVKAIDKAIRLVNDNKI